MIFCDLIKLLELSRVLLMLINVTMLSFWQQTCVCVVFEVAKIKKIKKSLKHGVTEINLRQKVSIFMKTFCLKLLCESCVFVISRFNVVEDVSRHGARCYIETWDVLVIFQAIFLNFLRKVERLKLNVENSLIKIDRFLNLFTQSRQLLNIFG